MESSWGCGNVVLRGCGGGRVDLLSLQGQTGATLGLTHAGTAGARVLDPGGWRQCVSTRGEGTGFVYFPIERFIDEPKSVTWDLCV